MSLYVYMLISDNLIIFAWSTCFQYIVPETSKNSLWKQFWDRFRTDDEGIIEMCNEFNGMHSGLMFVGWTPDQVVQVWASAATLHCVLGQDTYLSCSASLHPV